MVTYVFFITILSFIKNNVKKVKKKIISPYREEHPTTKLLAPHLR